MATTKGMDMSNEMVTLNEWRVLVHSDQGRFFHLVSAKDEATAIRLVMSAEGCPRRSIIRATKGAFIATVPAYTA